MATEILSAAQVPKLLVEMGVAENEAGIVVEPLSGGVSSAVFRADVGGRVVILKSALPRLKASREWLSDPARSSVEWKAAGYLSRIQPGRVPRPIAHDEKRHLFVMSAATDSVNWKDEMLGGNIDLAIAAMAGSLIGNIHEISGRDPETLAEFVNKQFFKELRVDAYVREVGRAHSKIRTAAELWAERLEGSAVCFVHGDFSPKNLLITPDRRLLLVDHEVAHWGDPSFDLAFFLTHLLAKSMRFAEARQALTASLTAYRAAAPGTWKLVEESGQLLGLVMLARVDGKSPLEYLTEAERGRLRSAAFQYIAQPNLNLAAIPPI